MRGSVVKHGRTWRYVVDVGRDPVTGKRKQVTKGGYRTKREAQEALGQIAAEVQQGAYVQPTKQTLADFLNEWIPAAKGSVAENTWQGYRIMADAYVIPRIGGMKLQQLTPLRLRGFYNDIEASGGRGGKPLSRTTVNNVHRFLRRAFRDAELPRNPAAETAPPKLPRRKIGVWTAPTLRAFLERAKVEGHRDRLAWVVLAATGLRRSECLRLRWEDFDFEAGTLSVEVSKSAAGSRQISIDPETLAFVRTHRGIGPTFPYVNPTVFSRRFTAAVRRWGFPPLGVHGLRHTHASLLLAAGVHPKIVSERLGHSTIQITLDLYSHLIPGIQEIAAYEIGNLLWSPDGHEKSKGRATAPTQTLVTTARSASEDRPVSLGS